MNSISKQSTCLLALLLFFSVLSNASFAQTDNGKPLRLAMAGATHSHIAILLGRKNKTDIDLVGIYEPNQELSARIARNYNLKRSIFYTDFKKMLDETKPEAVAAFGSIYEHMAAVEMCAPRGIHVMVEKPLAVSNEHAERMEQLAKKYHIYLLTDFETAWYPTNTKAYQLSTDSNAIGKIRKMVARDGHEGPIEIGVNKEFAAWLTDPIQNGGGALIDFGCYGANLMTFLMKGEKPISVTAVTNQYKPNMYPKVDDDATIVVKYPTAEAIIQGSWNWPFSVKDMQVFGETGYIYALNNSTMRYRYKTMKEEQTRTVTAKEAGLEIDPFTYFRQVVREKKELAPNDMYSLENNVMVVHILDAARQSAKTGKTVMLNLK